MSILAVEVDRRAVRESVTNPAHLGQLRSGEASVGPAPLSATQACLGTPTSCRVCPGAVRGTQAAATWQIRGRSVAVGGRREPADLFLTALPTARAVVR